MVEGYDYNTDFDLHDEPNEVDHVISVEEFERNVRSMNENNLIYLIPLLIILNKNF